MRSLASLLFLLSASHALAQPFWFSVHGAGPGPWSRILSSVGFQPRTGGGPVSIVVLGPEAEGSAGNWLAQVEGGAILILEGQSAVAESFGFHSTGHPSRVKSLQDVHQPELRIVWEQPLDLPVTTIPEGARIFARERWTGAPLLAGLRRGSGAVLWLAASPGEQGYERFPYLLHALRDLGLEPPFQARRLWAFFDSSYRTRADVDYLARRWRAAGIAALHVAAWHYYEPDAARDEFLRRLVAACHRNAILVYAWLELPHVSEKFWNDHPEWREKTAAGQDAHLDWRKLMNLANRDCFRAALAGINGLIERFDWDGVNLAELYFESLEGAANPARFTPMNGDVRREFRSLKGFDPAELFSGNTGPARLRAFLDYRADLARRIQTEWIAAMDGTRRAKPHLDMVLTHVDDRFDSGMRDAIGADAARILPLLEQHEFTFMVEDPATIWHLGPQRYPEIARRYVPLTHRAGKLAIDINIVERYQDVYPTKKQTGTELFSLLNLASLSFPRVALYFENSILPADLPFLPASTSAVTRIERAGHGLVVESRNGAGIPWTGPATVNGRAWPVTDGSTLWVPAGIQTIEPAGSEPPARILDFNGEVKQASVLTTGLELAYTSLSRAVAVLDRKPAALEIDGSPVKLTFAAESPYPVVLLPRGQHLADFRF